MEHFFLPCHNYDVQRKDLLDTANNILQPQGLLNLSNQELLKILLYGDERLPPLSNTIILKGELK